MSELQPFKCLYCNSTAGTFLSVEHPIPESLGNDEIVLPKGRVCDTCNRYFGVKLEEPILRKAPFGVERIMQAIKSKKGKYPTLQNDHFSLKSSGYWDGLILESNIPHQWMTLLPDGRLILNPEWAAPNEIVRFLIKMGLGLLANGGEIDIFDSSYDAARECARFGRDADKWEFGMGIYPRREDLVKAVQHDKIGPLETRQIYQYEIGVMDSGDVMFSFLFATMAFVVNLSSFSSENYILGFNQMNEFKIESRWDLF